MWTEEDQGKALAWQLEQSEKCPRCGVFYWEHDGDESAYEADGFHCPGCAELEEEKDRRKDDPDTPGVRIVLYPKE